VQQAAASAGLALPDAALLAFQQGRLIEAIKVIRTANPGLDLARAKAVMERMQAQARSAAADVDAGATPHKASMPVQPRRSPTVEMGDPPGQLRWVLVVAGLLATAAWFGFGGGS
jgi:hypothetical protein